MGLIAEIRWLYLVTMVLMLSLFELGSTMNQNSMLTMFTTQIAYNASEDKTYELLLWKYTYAVEVQSIAKHELPRAESFNGERLDGTFHS